jgi:hypothetical protein
VIKIFPLFAIEENKKGRPGAGALTPQKEEWINLR